MQYFGGKQRIADDIAPIIELLRGSMPYFEPFVGGANVITRIRGGVRIASDIVPELICLYQSVQRGWVPPRVLSRGEYELLKSDTRHTALRGFAAFGCSFGGKYFGGYANSPTRNYAANAASSLEKKRAGLDGVDFHCGDYRAFRPQGCLIYCDPPYAGTTTYAGAGVFNSAEFWAVCRAWAASGNIVLISEYNAPPDATLIWEKSVVTDIRGANGRIPRVERLYMMVGVSA